MMRRQYKTRHRGGLVRHASRPHHERNFLECLRDSRRRGHREDRISARDEYRIDLAGAHRVHHGVNFIRRAGLLGRRVFEEHDRLAKISGDRIENHRRKMCRRIVGARDRERTLSLAERLAELRDRLDRHAGACAGRRRIEIFYRLAERREIEARARRNLAVLDQHVEHAPRNVGLRTRRRRDPVVALRRRHAQSRTDVRRTADSQRAATILRRAELRILAREFHR